jgi:hypothetical protein
MVLIWENQTEQPDRTEKQALTTVFDQLNVQVAQLQHRVSRASLYLSAYDLRKCQSRIMEMEREIGAQREVWIPRKKFSFARKKVNLTTTETKPVALNTSSLLENIQAKEVVLEHR